MTPRQFKAALAALEITQETAAEVLGVSLRTINGYANGAPIPLATAKLLRLMVDLKLDPEEVN